MVIQKETQYNKKIKYNLGIFTKSAMIEVGEVVTLLWLDHNNWELNQRRRRRQRERQKTIAFY